MEHGQVVDEAVSTNDLARELGRKGAPSGAWISARRQTGGRGRLGRRWESLEGNLFFSMIARGVPRASLTWIPLAAGVACARAIDKVAPEVRTGLKWPNDLRADDAKLGGILCEACDDFVIVGIGINCAQAPEGLDQETTSLTEECGRDLTADELRPVLAEELGLALGELCSEGWRGIADAYEGLALLVPGTEIEWSNLRGRVLGLGEHGELKVRREDGRMVQLFAEDVRAVRPT
jgi:BirA family transcriptional regulator, biotin operon repressor / biotin---[acetyl-CoA-carboxylase] ligase